MASCSFHRNSLFVSFFFMFILLVGAVLAALEEDQDMRAMHEEAWMKEHGRVYEDAAEKDARFILEEEEIRGKMKSLAPPLELEGPSRVDWRDIFAVTPVEEQGNCGCSWAYAAVGAVEGIFKIQNNVLLSLSVQQVVDCVPSTDGCQGGSPHKAFEYIMDNGSHYCVGKNSMNFLAGLALQTS